MVLNVKHALRAAVLSLLPLVAQAQRNPGATEIRIGERPVLFGFALACVDCTSGEGPRGRVGGGGRANTSPVWSYRNYPQVEAVIPGGAADSAGIREGDILKAIDGLSLLSDDGTRRMSTAVAGQIVRLSFERKSKVFDISLKLGPSAGGRGMGDKEMIVSGHTVLRSSPTSGAGLEFDLWSDDAVRLAIDSATSTITFKIGEAVLRVRIPPSMYRDTTGAARGRGKPES